MHLNRVAAGAATTLAVGFIAACAADRTTAPMLQPGARPSASLATGQAPPLPSNVNDQGETCPTSLGWTKVNEGGREDRGSDEGLWGSFSFGGASGTTTKTLTYSVNAGYTVQFCLKYSNQVDYRQIVGAASGTLSTNDIAGSDRNKDISHVSWRAYGNATTIEMQNLQIAKSATARYDIAHSWALTKSITANGATGSSAAFSGRPGDQFSGDWNVEATKTTTRPSNYRVWGSVTITNPNGFDVGISVADMLRAGDENLQAIDVDCDPGTAGAQTTGTVRGNSTLECTYTTVGATIANLATATLNRATVTVTSPTAIPSGYSGDLPTGGIATAPISFQENTIGANEAVLVDALVGYGPETLNTSSDRLRFPITESCPTDPAVYDANGVFSKPVVENVAELTPTGENKITQTASYTLTCQGFRGETATGAGHSWGLTTGGTGNWFMYSPWAATPFTRFALLQGYTIALDLAAVNEPTVRRVPLVAGQQFVVGAITAQVAANGQRTLTITLSNVARLANVSNNVKIHPMASCGTNQNYVQPGQFSIKQTGLNGPISVPSTVTVTDSRGRTSQAAVTCYGIHVDVLRFLGS